MQLFSEQEENSRCPLQMIRYTCTIDVDKKNDAQADNDQLSFQNKALCAPSKACNSSDIKLRSQANGWINEKINILTEFDMNGMEYFGTTIHYMT